MPAHDPLRALIEQALDLETPEAREQLLAACADPVLAAEARALLDLQQQAERLQRSAAPWLAAEASPTLPASIGPYRILGLLGTGGMGAVYHGVREDGSFRKEAAIKIVRDAFSTENRMRFQRERELLSRLEHPAIARVLDGGTTETGQLWMAIDKIDGMPLDQYVRANQLALSARLQLMLRILDAVQYAHQNLIVHRDLKPANVLVQVDGQPKLLDFGVAKLLGDVEHTHTAERAPMTFAYAAPEQIKGDAVTTATDVYAIGVMLYELLTGERPHKAKGENALSLLQAITDTDATAPSEMLRQRGRMTTTQSDIGLRELRGDLDTIVLKSLSRDPARRYPSAQALREDLERYLSNRPILARPDAFAYLASKWIRRNRLAAAIAGVAVIGLALAAALVIQERNRAIKNAQVAEATKRFVLKAFTGANRWVAGESLSARDLALRGLAEVATELKDQPEARVEMYDTLGFVLGRSGPISASVQAREAQIREMQNLGSYSASELKDAKFQLLYTYWWAEDVPKTLAYQRDVEREHGDQLTLYDRTSMSHLTGQIAAYLGDYHALANAVPGSFDDLAFQTLSARSRADQQPFVQTFRSYGQWYWLEVEMQQRLDRSVAARALQMAQTTDRDIDHDNLNRGGFMMFIADYLLRVSRDPSVVALAQRTSNWLDAQFGSEHGFALYLPAATLYADLQDGKLESAELHFKRLEAIQLKAGDEAGQYNCRNHYLDGGYVALKQQQLGRARERFAKSLACAKKFEGASWTSPHARAAQAALVYLEVLEGTAQISSLTQLASEQLAKKDGWWWWSAAWLANAHWQRGEKAQANAILEDLRRWHVSRGARFDSDLLLQFEVAGLPVPAQPKHDIAEVVRIGTRLIADGERMRAQRLAAGRG